MLRVVRRIGCASPRYGDAGVEISSCGRTRVESSGTSSSTPTPAASITSETANDLPRSSFARVADSESFSIMQADKLPRVFIAHLE